MKKTLLLLSIGLVSGLITNLFLIILINKSYDSEGLRGLLFQPPMLIPGIVFGIFSLFSFFFILSQLSTNQKIYKSILWIIISTLAFIAAYWAAFWTFAFTTAFFSIIGMGISGFIGGFVGTLVLCVGFLIIFQKINRIITLILLGGVLGSVSFVIMGYFKFDIVTLTGQQPVSSILYIIWQTGMLWAICINIKKKEVLEITKAI